MREVATLQEKKISDRLTVLHDKIIKGGGKSLDMYRFTAKADISIELLNAVLHCKIIRNRGITDGTGSYWEWIATEDPRDARLVDRVIAELKNADKDMEETKNNVGKWTDEEITFLKENYHVLGPKGCCEALGKNYNTCATKASVLGLTGKPGQRPYAEANRYRGWKKSDIVKLKKLMREGHSSVECAEQLGRSVKSIMTKAHRLGVKFSDFRHVHVEEPVTPPSGSAQSNIQKDSKTVSLSEKDLMALTVSTIDKSRNLETSKEEMESNASSQNTEVKFSFLYGLISYRKTYGSSKG